jgi:hypothetical protein
MKKLIVGLPVRAGIAHAPAPASSTIIVEVLIVLLRFASWGLPRLLSSREADAPRRIAPASGSCRPEPKAKDLLFKRLKQVLRFAQDDSVRGSH